MIHAVSLHDAWIAAIWRAGWQGGLAALFVWSVCRCAPSLPARFQSWLWRLAALKFVVALLWSVPLELPLLSPQPVLSPSSLPHLVPIPFAADSAVPQPVAEPGTYVLILFLGWGVVVAWQGFQIVLACRAAHRLRNGATLNRDRRLLDQLDRFSESVGLRSPPKLLEMEGRGSPLLVGFFRPAIILPSTTLRRLDDAERTLVLGHELAHVRRGDLLWNLVAAVMRSLFFFHPLAWLCERRLRLAQEIAADELAIGLQQHDSARYAAALVSAVSKFDSVPLLPAMSVGVSGSHQTLQRRLLAMRSMQPVSHSRAVAYGLVVAATALSGLVPWVVVPAQTFAADDAAPKEMIHRGKFVSFKGGVLRIKGEDGKEFDGIEVADNTKVVNFVKGNKIEGTAPEAFKIWEPGAVVAVTMKNGSVTLVEIGVKKEADQIPDRVPNKTSAKASQKEKFVWGKFVSFQNGELVIQANSGALIENEVPANAKTLVWNHDEGAYKPADTVATLSQLKAGTWTVVNATNENVMVRIGARKGSTTGTFVSFKDNRLLILGKNLGESFTKKYGNNVHFHKFRDDVPVYESVDGGEYQLLGTANKVLGDVKEGAIVTVHGEGDDNITLVQIGTPKKR